MHSFHLPVALGVVSCGVGDLDTERLPQVEEELAGELRPVIGVDVLGVPLSCLCLFISHDLMKYTYIALCTRGNSVTTLAKVILE